MSEQVFVEMVVVEGRRFELPRGQGHGMEGTVFQATDAECEKLSAAGLARRNDPADRETKPSKAKLETK